MSDSSAPTSAAAASSEPTSATAAPATTPDITPPTASTASGSSAAVPANNCLAKVTPEDIRQCILQARPPKSVALNVLLVDENTVVHHVMCSRFKVLKWNATSAYNGMDAVTLFKNTSFTNIDAVLMDTEMPVVHGETAAATLVELGCKTPIIALTSNDFFDEGA